MIWFQVWTINLSMNNILSLSLYFGRQNTENPEEEGDPQDQRKGGLWTIAHNHHPSLSWSKLDGGVNEKEIFIVLFCLSLGVFVPVLSLPWLIWGVGISEKETTALSLRALLKGLKGMGLFFTAVWRYWRVLSKGVDQTCSLGSTSECYVCRELKLEARR